MVSADNEHVRLLVGCSLSCDTELFIRLLLFFGQCAEEPDFLLAWRLPLIVRFECALKMRFDVDVKRLRFEVRIWRIIDTWHCLCRCQVMEISCELRKLCSCSLLLPFLFILCSCLVVFIEIFTHLFILGFNMLQVLLSGVEVMLVLSAVESSIAKEK